VAGGLLGFGVGEPLAESFGLIEATGRDGSLSGLAVDGLSTIVAAAGAVVGVVFALIGPILKLLPIGHN